MGGSQDPESDTNRKARNTEFELYVGGLLCLAGANVGFAEPDLRVLTPGRTAGIAVKRMTSLAESKLVTRLAEAAAQIERAHGIGYVAVNIDAYFRNDVLEAGEEDRTTQFDARLRKVVAAVGQALGDRRSVRGVLAFGYMDAWDTGTQPPRHRSAHPTAIQLIEDDGDPMEQVLAIRTFWSRVLRSMQAEVHHLVSGRRA